MSQRKSRLPVRTKSMERPSGSVKLCSNTLRPSYKPRSSSCSITSSNSTTPANPSTIRRGRLFRTKSPMPRDPVSMNNKEWQSIHLKKIGDFIQSVDCNLKLKPVTTKTFVAVCKILLEEIDDQLNINEQNYMQLLPRWLKGLGYTGQVSTSFFRCLNTNHAFPNVLALWSFLYELGKTQEVKYFNIKDQEALKKCNDHILILCHTKEEDDELDFNSLLHELYNSDFSDLEETAIEVENQRVKDEHTKLQSKLKELEATSEKAKKDYDGMKFQLEQKENERRRVADEIDKIDKQIFEANEENQQFITQIDEILKELADLNFCENKMLEDIRIRDELKHSLKLLEDRRRILVEQRNKSYAENSTLKMAVKDLLFEINNKIMEKLSDDTNYKSLLLPESGFTEMEFCEELEKKELLYRDKAIDLSSKVELMDVATLAHELENFTMEHNNITLACRAIEVEIGRLTAATQDVDADGIKNLARVKNEFDIATSRLNAEEEKNKVLITHLAKLEEYLPLGIAKLHTLTKHLDNNRNRDKIFLDNIYKQAFYIMATLNQMVKDAQEKSEQDEIDEIVRATEMVENFIEKQFINK